MDDYNTSVLSEAKNEYSNRLVGILSPLIVEGIKSIFNEAVMLCSENDEDEKYLMTFQNFLSRVPKWNDTIISEESDRILKKSGCSYLEDLLTCVHITQLKILTSIRVSSKQKKIDIEIPKLGSFIHKIYITLARKLYKSVYLFEKNIDSLAHQKNMRECDILCKESILEVISENMPVESILRAYMDETIEEDIIEETIEEIVNKNKDSETEEKNNVETANKDENNTEKEEVEIKKIDTSDDTSDKTKTEDDVIEIKTETLTNNSDLPPVEKKTDNLKLQIEEFKDSLESQVNELKETMKNKPKESPVVSSLKPLTETKLSFNDKDMVLDMGTNKSEEVSAPKTIERLEQIGKDRAEKRKEEEDDDFDDDKIKIFGAVDLETDTLDILDKSKPNNTDDDILELEFDELP